MNILKTIVKHSAVNLAIVASQFLRSDGLQMVVAPFSRLQKFEGALPVFFHPAPIETEFGSSLVQFLRWQWQMRGWFAKFDKNATGGTEPA